MAMMPSKGRLIMFHLFKRLAVPLATVAMFALAPPVQATTVEYYTVGYFTFTDANNEVYTTTPSSSVPGAQGSTYVTFTNTSVDPTDSSQTASITVDQPSDTHPATLTWFNSSLWQEQHGYARGTTTVDVGALPEETGFGSLQVSGNGSVPAADFFDGIGLTLEFHQIQPQAGTDSLVGRVTGSIGKFNGSPELAFVPTNFTWIPDTATGVKYTVYTPVALGSGTTDILGTVAAPLPATASMGLGLFSLIGFWYAWRSLRQRHAAA
jgi:hypothetical protein